MKTRGLLLAIALLVATPASAASRAVCPPTARSCFALDLVLAASGPTEATRKADASWWQAHLDFANAAFAKAGIGFVTGSRAPLPRAHHHLDDVAARDRAGQGRVSRGRILVIAPRRLLDSDDKTRERHGVHWRDRADKRGEDRRRRWVIVVNGSDRPGWDMAFTLAHELGHFFGLPHSKVPASIMNTSPNERPPMTTWRFEPSELRRIEQRARQMVRNGRLRRVNRRHVRTLKE